MKRLYLHSTVLIYALDGYRSLRLHTLSQLECYSASDCCVSLSGVLEHQLKACGAWLGEDDPIGSRLQVPEHPTYGSLQAAMSLDKERGLALLAGRLLLALLELAVPVKEQLLQQLRSEGRNVRAHQREEPDDLQQARQELEALLTQIQPEPYKFYERWDVLLSSDRGTRRTGALINDLWRALPEQVRLKPEGAGELRRFTGCCRRRGGGCASSSSRTAITPPTPRPIRPSIPSHGTWRCCAWRKCQRNCTAVPT